jgi:hypothetical protein
MKMARARASTVVWWICPRKPLGRGGLPQFRVVTRQESDLSKFVPDAPFPQSSLMRAWAIQTNEIAVQSEPSRSGSYRELSEGRGPREVAVDDFVAGRIPLKQHISTRFNKYGPNSLNHNKLKIGHL